MQSSLEAASPVSTIERDVRIPGCVGIIMDGNRRWARAKGLPTLSGHRAGLDMYKKIAQHARVRGVQHLTAYMFSTENWSRSAQEVAYLLELFKEAAQKHLRDLLDQNIRIRFIGERQRFSPELQELMQTLETESQSHDGMALWACLSYGGRAEIAEAARSLAREGTEITEEALRRAMWSAEMPDPDLIIRTSGEYRLSNFLLWQLAYSELVFTDTLWPDFSEAEFDYILTAYAAHERRHGK